MWDVNDEFLIPSAGEVGWVHVALLITCYLRVLLNIPESSRVI